MFTMLKAPDVLIATLMIACNNNNNTSIYLKTEDLHAHVFWGACPG